MARAVVIQDISDQKVDAGVSTSKFFDFHELKITSPVAMVVIQAKKDQLAEIADAIRRHLESVGYHEYPDADRILAAECEAAIEAEAHGISMDRKVV